jgi:hypothetical protein
MIAGGGEHGWSILKKPYFPGQFYETGAFVHEHPSVAPFLMKHC